MKKPEQILQAEIVLVEIALLRDNLKGDEFDLVEASWRGINVLRQQLIDSLTLEEELDLEKLKQEIASKRRSRSKGIRFTVPPCLSLGQNPILN